MSFAPWTPNPVGRKPIVQSGPYAVRSKERVDEFLSGVWLADLLAEEAVVAEMLSQPTGVPA